MPGEGRSRGIVTHIAPDLSYLTVKDRSGGRKAYLSNASETIKRLGLNTQTEKRVSFTYKQGGPTEMKEIEYVERDIPGDDNVLEGWVKGNVTQMECDGAYLVIKECSGGKLPYIHDSDEAHSIFKELELWKPENENKTVLFKCSLNEPPEVMEVKPC